jgi:hypothetical protein
MKPLKRISQIKDHLFGILRMWLLLRKTEKLNKYNKNRLR